MILNDQLNRQVNLKGPACRIVTLVPSISELIAYLAGNDRLAGVTKFCVHPESLRSSSLIIGGTKNPDFDKIKNLDPDLIIANREENRKEDISILEKTYPVYVSDVRSVDHALHLIKDMGIITGTQDRASELIEAVRENFAEIKKAVRLRVLYIIWNEPVMIAGIDNYINDMLKFCGFKNAYDGNQRYPEMNEQEIHDLKPDLLLLSSEPFPFKEKHIEKFSKISPGSKVILVDGEAFSWYGSRMLNSANYLTGLISGLETENNGTGKYV